MQDGWSAFDSWQRWKFLFLPTHPDQLWGSSYLPYTTNLIICGDINIDYLKTSNYKTWLDYLLASYNLSTAVDFPTRITDNTSTAIDNIFIDESKKQWTPN